MSCLTQIALSWRRTSANSCLGLMALFVWTKMFNALLISSRGLCLVLKNKTELNGIILRIFDYLIIFKITLPMNKPTCSCMPDFIEPVSIKTCYYSTTKYCWVKLAYCTSQNNKQLNLNLLLSKDKQICSAECSA